GPDQRRVPAGWKHGPHLPGARREPTCQLKHDLLHPADLRTSTEQEQSLPPGDRGRSRAGGPCPLADRSLDATHWHSSADSAAAVPHSMRVGRRDVSDVERWCPLHHGGGRGHPSLDVCASSAPWWRSAPGLGTQTVQTLLVFAQVFWYCTVREWG